MIGTRDARASASLLVGATGGVATLAVVAAGLGQAADRLTQAAGGSGIGGWTALVVAVASGLFLAAGVVRLATWQLAHDVRDGLVGASLILMGGLCLPLGGFAQLLVPGEDSSVIGTAVRFVATCLAWRVVLLALVVREDLPRYRPARTLPWLFVIVSLTFVLLITTERLRPDVLSGDTLPPAALSAVMALGWFAVAARVAARGRDLPWARRAAPLFLGMGLAEVLRGLDAGRIDTWTFSAVMLCASMAAFATRSALIDLDGTVRADRHQMTDLSVAVNRLEDEATELTVWREQLTHDARNACAGVRAAMDILQRYDGRVDASTSRRLRLAAVEEIGYLEHLLFRSSAQPCEEFEVGEVVRQVGETARSLGARVRVGTGRGIGVGRPGDVAAVLRSLLVNAQTHAPGSRVDLEVTVSDGTVTITCRDDGPGLGDVDPAHVFDRGYRGATSPGSGLGLYAARELMREQDGDLSVGRPRPGATFLITLPAAARGTRPSKVPGQRLTTPTSALLELNS